jgi:hypothetical protein
MSEPTTAAADEKTPNAQKELTAMVKAKMATTILENLEPYSDLQKLEIIDWVRLAISPNGGITSSDSRPILKTSQELSNGEAHDPGVIPGETIQKFLKRKDPANTYQRLACLGYYLEDINGKNMASYGNSDLVAANDDARLFKMSNPSSFISDAIYKYHFFSSTGGLKKLTTIGQEIVRALPNRDEAQKYIATARKKSPAKSSSTAPKA